MCEMEVCNHSRSPGRTRCNACSAAYMRWLRQVSEPRKVATARREGRDAALREACIMLLEVGDLQITGFKSAEMVRRLIGLD